MVGNYSTLHRFADNSFYLVAVKGKNDGETLSFFTTPLTARNMVIFYPDPLFFAFFPIFSYFFLIFKSPPPL